MKKLMCLLCVLVLVGCATTPFENESAAGVRIYITLGDNARVQDITVTTASDNTQDTATSAKQDATQSTAVSLPDPASLTPAGAAGGALNKLIK